MNTKLTRTKCKIGLIGCLAVAAAMSLLIASAKPAEADGGFSISISSDAFHIGYRSCNGGGGYRYWTPGCYDAYGRWEGGYFSGPVVYPTPDYGNYDYAPGYDVAIGGYGYPHGHEYYGNNGYRFRGYHYDGDDHNYANNWYGGLNDRGFGYNGTGYSQRGYGGGQNFHGGDGWDNGHNFGGGYDGQHNNEDRNDRGNNYQSNHGQFRGGSGDQYGR